MDGVHLEQITHLEKIKQANESVSQATSRVTEDPHRLIYHASPQVFWMNDPNGLIYFRGEYHLFFQHNPYSPKWGTIHWGHMKSKDLIHWEHLPIALAPSEEYDQHGCYSGCAVEHEGLLYLVYTAKTMRSSSDGSNISLQQQCIAVSSDGITFEKIPQNPVIPSPPEAVGQNDHFRDPKVWRYNDFWYMVLGTKKNDRGKIVLYRSTDLVSWSFVNVVTESDGTMGHMYECPDLFRLDSRDVLLFSPEGAAFAEGMVSGYYLGHFDYHTEQYKPHPFQRLDHGFDFYAPQTMVDPQGRRILLAWMPMDGASLDKEWSGCMTLPRELKWVGGTRLLMQPIEEMKRLRTNQRSVRTYSVTAGGLQSINGIHGDCLELLVIYDLQNTNAKEFGLHVRASRDGLERTVITYFPDTGDIVIDRSHAGMGVSGVCTCRVEALEQHTLTLHLFLDRSTLELFINDGEYVMSGLIFPEASSQDIRFFSVGGTAAIHSLDCWALRL
jgi:beta-fructofuranosidase